MKERDGKDGGPGEDSTLLERKEENPEKVTPMPMPVWKKNLRMQRDGCFSCAALTL